MRLHFASALALAVIMGSAASAASVTDITVVGTNEEGNNWNGLLWNTQGAPADTRGIYNLYLSTSSDLSAPSFVNSHDNSRTEVNLALAPGHYDYTIFGEGVGAFDPWQHFVLNLYLDGNQSAPSISGLVGPGCAGLCAAGHPNGLGIYGNSGEQEAGVLAVVLGGLRITLSDFAWGLSEGVDQVWETWANDEPYAGGSGRTDAVGASHWTSRRWPRCRCPRRCRSFWRGWGRWARCQAAGGAAERPSARARNGRIGAATVSGASSCIRWPSPAKSTTSAWGMRAAASRLTEGGTARSASPVRKSVGVAMPGRRESSPSSCHCAIMPSVPSTWAGSRINRS